MVAVLQEHPSSTLVVGCRLVGEEAGSDSLCLMLAQPRAGLVALGSEVCDSGSRSRVGWQGCSQPLCCVPVLSCCRFCETQCKAHSEGGCGEPRKNLQHVVRRCGPLSTENLSSSEL